MQTRVTASISVPFRILGSASVSDASATSARTDDILAIANFFWALFAPIAGGISEKVRFGATPKPARVTRALPRVAWLPHAAAIVLCIMTTAAICPAATPTKAAITQIRSVLQAQQAAWNQGDIDGFMNGYARTPSTVFISEDTVERGWETVRDRYKKKYSSRAKMGMLTFSDLEVTLLEPDSAVAIGRWNLKRANDQPHGRFTLILRRLPEGWRIVHDHTSAAPPPSSR